MTHRLTLCAGCALGQGDLPERLQAALPDWQVGRVDCMSGCRRPSTASFRAPGKTAYLFGDLTEADAAPLVAFAQAYRASATGQFADARIFGDLRLKALARIPP